MIYLFQYFKGYLKETVLGPVFKLLEASFELLVPLVIAKIIDDIIPHKNQGNLVLMIFILIILALVGVSVAITAQYFSSKAAVRYTENLTKALYKKVLRLPKTSQDDISSASLIARLSTDTFQIQTGINQFLRLFLRAPIIIVGSISMVVWLQARLAVYYIGMVFVLFIVVWLLSKITAPLYHRLRQLLDKMVAQTREQMAGLRVIRAFNQQKAEQAAFNMTNHAYQTAQVKAGCLSSLMSPLTYIVVNTTLLLVIWRGEMLINQSLLSQGMLIALVNYLLQILVELLKVAMLVTSLTQSYISAQRVHEIFLQEDEKLDEPLALKHGDATSRLSVCDMTFTYPKASEPALKDINFQIKAFERLGVIGGTGAGKSTLVKLLTRLYLSDKGEVTIFHEGKSPQTVRQWRDWVRVVPQKAVLFKGTVRQNLLLGVAEKVEDDILWRALEIAQAADFVRHKVGGLDSEVEAFGRNFSGGQRQRLAIARALVRPCHLLILDDATSALDSLTEQRLLSELQGYLLDTSLVLISQRIHALKTMDKILVLDKGVQVGLGKHERLLQESPVYQAIYQSQEIAGGHDERS